MAYKHVSPAQADLSRLYSRRGEMDNEMRSLIAKALRRFADNIEAGRITPTEFSVQEPRFATDSDDVTAFADDECGVSVRAVGGAKR